MKRAIVAPLIVWALFVLGVAIHGAIVALDGGTRIVGGTLSVPAASDGLSKYYVIQRVVASDASGVAGPLWTRRILEFSKTSPDGAGDDAKLTAVDIPSAFTVRCENARGDVKNLTITWVELARWNASGTEIIFTSGTGDFIRSRVAHFDREWDAAAVHSFVQGRAMLCAVVLAPSIAFACLFSVLRVTRAPQRHRCKRCDYDLRGNPGGGCPECGWNREP